jgi:hypothetical protein
MQSKLRVLLSTSLLVLFSFLSVLAQGQTATVTSDKPDYAPRSTAVFTGRGFLPNENVVLKVKNLNSPCNTVTADSSYLPWTVQADGNGSFVTNWTVCDCVGDSLRLRATGQISGLIAYAYFTDGNVNFGALGLPVGTTVKVTNIIYTEPNGDPGDETEKSFTTPGTSTNIGAKNNTTLSYTYPQKITTSPTSSFYLISSSPVSGYTVAANLQTVRATYKEGAKIILNGLTGQVYNGTEKVVTATTTPGGIPVITIYKDANGNTLQSKPTRAGIYTVIASLNNTSYQLIDNNDNVVSSISAEFVISPKQITGSFTADNKVYDGNNSAAVLSRTPNGVVGTDAVTLTGGTATFSDKNVANGKTVTLTGASLAGGDKDNYSLTSVGTATADITAKALVIGITAQDKEYDGTTAASTAAAITSGLVSGDVVTVASANGAFNDKNVGADKPVTADVSKGGADAGNYSANTTASATADITARPITVTADVKVKMVGAVDPPLTYQITNGTLVIGEEFDGSLSRVAGEIPGPYEIQKGTLALSTNYDLSYVPANLTIYAFPVVTLSVPSPVPINNNSTINSSFTGVVLDREWVYTNTVTGVTIVSETDPQVVVKSSTPIVYAVYQRYQNAVGDWDVTPVTYAVFYDPNSGFVTGGGWITSPVVSELPYMQVSGKANFGFVSKYEKGKTVPSGNTEFQFQAGGLNFKSSVYEWLVISGIRAQYKGSGTINGTGDYGFLLTAIDGDLSPTPTADKFRIKIWNKSNGSTVYDNQYLVEDGTDPTTIIGGGSIVIHTPNTGGKKTSAVSADARVAEVIEPTQFAFRVFPNPSISSFNVQVESDNVKDKINVRVMDLYGRTVEVINGAASGQTIKIGAAYRPGIYFVEMIQGNKRKQIKLLKQAD